MAKVPTVLLPEASLHNLRDDASEDVQRWSGEVDASIDEGNCEEAWNAYDMMVAAGGEEYVWERFILGEDEANEVLNEKIWKDEDTAREKVRACLNQQSLQQVKGSPPWAARSAKDAEKKYKSSIRSARKELMRADRGGCWMGEYYMGKAREEFGRWRALADVARGWQGLHHTKEFDAVEEAYTKQCKPAFFSRKRPMDWRRG